MEASNLLIALAALLGAGIAIYGLARPFVGVLLLMTLHFVQPGELIPALSSLRLELVYGILMLIVLARKKASEIKVLLKTDPIVRATILLEAVIILTIPFAIWPGGAFQAALDVVKMIVLQMLMTFFIDSQDRLRYILWLLVSFMMWFAGSSFTAYVQGQYYEVNGVQRAEGVNSMVGGPNQLAGLLLALLPFLIALMLCTKSIVLKLLLVAGGMLTLFVLLLTGARIALIALALMALFYILRSKRKALNFAVATVLALALWFSLPKQYQDRYLTVKHYAEGGNLDDSNKLRLQIWDAGWRMFLDHPILGVGAGQFPTAYGTVYAGKFHTAWMNPHNLLLQVTCELGLVGLFVFGNFLLQVWKGIREVLRRKDYPGFEVSLHFAVACNFMLIGVGLISSVSHTLYRPYWYLLAGMVAANRAVALQVLHPGSDSSAREFETNNRFGEVPASGLAYK